MTTSHAAGALALGLSLVASQILASEPASQDIAVPAEGKTVVLQWTGTAMPGVTAVPGTVNYLATDIGGAPAVVGCAPGGVLDDGHDINLAVPDGFYDSHQVLADFKVEWDAADSGVDGVYGDPDLALSVYQDALTLAGYSDGSGAEAVSLTNPAAGTYTAIVCPFTSSAPVEYRARLTLTTLAPKACIKAPGGVVSNALPSGTASASLADLAGFQNFDLFSNETRGLAKTIPTDAHGRLGQVIYDRAFGTPTFLWARQDAAPAALGALSARDLLVEGARAHLRSEAKELHLTASLIDEARVVDAGFNGNGPAVVRFRQSVNGIEVFQRSLAVMLDRSYKPVAVSGYFATDFRKAALPSFALTPAQAVAGAWTHLGGALSASALTPAQSVAGWQWFERPNVSGTHVFNRGPRAKAIWYARNGALEPAFYVELFANSKLRGDLLAYGIVVSAVDGRVLQRDNLKADAFSYRVYADAQGPVHQPYDSPLGNGYDPFPSANRSDKLARKSATASLVTLDNAGISTGDPWLAADATSTSGNNVDACKDAYDQGVDTPIGSLAVPPPVNSCVKQVEPNTPVTGDHTFDYPLEADADPLTKDGVGHAVVNLFYMNNWLHDIWYDHGFDEAAGNAQLSNYDRGGEDGDPILAQAQDASGRSNANMATPSDGSSPVMQQYLFDGPLLGHVRQVAPIQGKDLHWTVIHDTGDDDYDLDGDLVLANDGLGVSPSDGCGPAYPLVHEITADTPVGGALPLAPVAPPDPNLQGKIALVDRGNCNTTYKAQFALASGAVAVIVVNNVDGEPPGNIGNLDIPLAPVQPTGYVYDQIPILFIRKDDGAALKAQLASGQAVTMHLDRKPSIDADGTRDNQIIAHEFFHYVHHRLTDSSNQQSSAMSEGWGDIDAFMMTVRPEDKLVKGNGNLGGAYGLAGYVQDNFYNGIRRAPYSTSFADNAFTLKHISDGEPTPDGGAGASNSEVHSAGEIWANEVFECYVGIQNNPAHGFADARDAMRDYIIAGLKMTPANATYTEARDAILAAALATDAGDFSRCAHGFARRGSGLNAVAPARGSSDLTGVVEDYTDFTCSASPRDGEIPQSSGGGSLLAGGFAPGLLLPLVGAAFLRRRRKS